MFESSVVESRKKVNGRRYATLPISIAVHTIAAAGALFGAVWNVSFPAGSPEQVNVYRPSVVPSLPPIGRSGGAPRTVSPPRPPAAAPPRSTVLTAPSAEPAVASRPESGVASQSTDTVGSASNSDSGGLLDGGDPNGDPSSDNIDGVLTSKHAEPSSPLRPGGDVKAPVLIRKVEPAYPTVGVKIRAEGIVIMECIIDRSGRVRQTTVLRSDYPFFAQAAEEAVRQWKYVPGSLNGRSVETLLTLTVRFALK